MAVTQISRIQHRRGLEQDLPQLASAEFGWSLDTRKLYIGNGTLDEGAPTLGVTEILTQYSDLTALLGTYTFVGNVTGYTVQTGSSLLNPTVRSFQQKFDDFVNVRDFGARGNGIDDDYTALNRAITEIYRTSINETDNRTRRTIYIPGGTYITSQTIKIPPYARIVGDGIESTIIKAKFGNISVANLCDSSFNSGAAIGSGTAVLPQGIEISGIKFLNQSAGVNQPIINIDSASNIRIVNTQFGSNVSSTVYPNVVHISSTVTPVTSLTFDGCQFIGGGNGISNFGATKSLSIMNSTFDNLSNVALILNDMDSISALNNYYGTMQAISSKNSALSFTSFGEVFQTGDVIGGGGVFIGNLAIGMARGASVSTQSVVATIVPNTSGKFNYEISNSSAKRFGVFTFSTDGSNNIFTDNYTESVLSIKANLYANADSLICSCESGQTATLKYSLIQFV